MTPVSKCHEVPRAEGAGRVLATPASAQASARPLETSVDPAELAKSTAALRDATCSQAGDVAHQGASVVRGPWDLAVPGPSVRAADCTSVARGIALAAPFPTARFPARADDVERVSAALTSGPVCLRGIPRSGNSSVLAAIEEQARAQGRLVVQLSGNYTSSLELLESALDRAFRRRTESPTNFAEAIAAKTPLTVTMDEAVLIAQQSPDVAAEVIVYLRAMAAEPNVQLLLQVHVNEKGDALCAALGFQEHLVRCLSPQDVRGLLEVFAEGTELKFSPEVVAAVHGLAPYAVAARLLTAAALQIAASETPFRGVLPEHVLAAVSHDAFVTQLGQTGLVELARRLHIEVPVLAKVAPEIARSELSSAEAAQLTRCAALGLVEETPDGFARTDNLALHYFFNLPG